MNLSEEESKFLDELWDIKLGRSHRSIPSPPWYDQAFIYLTEKSIHNHCSNPQCEYGKAKESEITCPACGSNIFKMTAKHYAESAKK